MDPSSPTPDMGKPRLGRMRQPAKVPMTGPWQSMHPCPGLSGSCWTTSHHFSNRCAVVLSECLAKCLPPAERSGFWFLFVSFPALSVILLPSPHLHLHTQ